MKKIPIILTLMIILIQTGTSQHYYSDAFIAQKADSYTIDAIGNEAFWAQCDWYEIPFIWLPYGTTMIEGDFVGRVKFAWTADKLLVLAEIEDNILSDTHDNPQFEYYKDDCFEVFLDEDYSGGLHERNFNAFAYHCAINEEDVIDTGDETHSDIFVNDHVDLDLDTIDGTHFIWELAIAIYDETFDPDNSNNTILSLEQGKEMGIAVAYCDNDGGNDRENFIGLINVSSEHQNSAWQDASVFGKLTLQDELISLNNNHTSDADEFSIYLNNECDLIIENLSSVRENVSIFLYDLNGQMINEEKGYLGDKLEMKVSGLKHGLYVVHIEGSVINTSMLINHL